MKLVSSTQVSWLDLSPALGAVLFVCVCMCVCVCLFVCWRLQNPILFKNWLLDKLRPSLVVSIYWDWSSPRFDLFLIRGWWSVAEPDSGRGWRLDKLRAWSGCQPLLDASLVSAVAKFFNSECMTNREREGEKRVAEPNSARGWLLD